MTTVNRLRSLIALLSAVVLLESMTLVVIETRAPSMPPTTATPPPTTSVDTMRVTVYFHRVTSDDPAFVVPVHREVPKAESVVEATLNALTSGPTPAERSAGHRSVFVPETARTLRSVRIVNGVVQADFLDFSAVIPEAGRTELLAELDTTVEQFPDVRSAVYSFNGSTAAFYHWLGVEPPAAAGDIP